jgi:arginase
VLRELGLVEALDGTDLGDVEAPRYEPVQLPGQRRNERGLVEYSAKLGAAVADALEGGQRCVVMGGDCSILLGVLAGAREAGVSAVLHLDGHTDFRHEGNHRCVGAVAGEDLALAVGLGPKLLTEPLGAGPLVAPANAAHLGARPDDEHLPEAIATLGLVRTAGQILSDIGGTTEAVRSFAARRSGRMWVHLDIDILDPVYMPAVDAPSPGGLDPYTAAVVLRSAVDLPNFAGLSVSVYDPARDASRTAGRLVVDLLRAAAVPR